jgi:hypothetical protein
MGRSLPHVTGLDQSEGVSLSSSRPIYTTSDVIKMSLSQVVTINKSDSVIIPRRFISMGLCVSMFDSATVMSASLWHRWVTVRPWSFKSKHVSGSHFH